ncbi:MAG: hypothetical protein KDI56_17045, partial [Xanthomonadales bacterium]|nr:hypothetical protein [Xanthomonadales bacterium]
MNPIDYRALAERVRQGQISRFTRQLAGSLAQQIQAGVALSDDKQDLVSALLESMAVSPKLSTEHRIRKVVLERRALTGELITRKAAMAALDRKDGNRAGAAKKSLGRERSAARAEAWDAYITGAWVPDIDTDEAIADACAGLPDELSVMSRQL